jgi:hypothetical protein
MSDEGEKPPTPDPAGPDKAPEPGEAAADKGGGARKAGPDGGQHTERDAKEDLASLGSRFAGNNYNYNINTLHGTHATLGPSAGSAGEDSGRRARTGRLTAEEISALCAHFAEPPLFRPATEALDRDRVVFLGGAGGLGKRTSAVHLLLNAGAAPLEVVSPALNLEELSKHDFEADHGYLIEDWQLAPRADHPSDFGWRVFRDHVNDAKAFLVITAAEGTCGQSVRRFAWQRPSEAEVLAAYVPDERMAGPVAEIAGKAPDTYGMAELAVIGQRLAKGDDPATILAEMSHDPGRHVREWLAVEDRKDDDIQQVIALCFATGQSQRIFEAMFIRLGSTLCELGLVSESEEQEKKKSAGLSDLRSRGRQNELLERKDGRVYFRGKEPSYQYLSHRHALQELWAEYDMSFWIAVRSWLTELIGDTAIHDVQVSVALGLAVLAFSALEEVEDSYLHPWAAGEQGWPGQGTAVYVLWLMSRDDTLAPIALRITTDWVNTGDPACQWTAAAALSGELGAVYPAEAASRLWHLVGQWKDIPTEAVVALATLFATLVNQAEGQEAYRVLELLRERLDRVSHRNGEDGGLPGQPSVSWRDDRRNRERALICIVEVLAARDPRTKQPSVTSLLTERPEHLKLVAGLWATVLCYRPLRRRALVALLEAVRSFEYVSDDPQAAARALGDALTEALRSEDRQPLNRDFVNILARSKRPETDTAATVQALLDAWKHLEPTERTAP